MRKTYYAVVGRKQKWNKKKDEYTTGGPLEIVYAPIDQSDCCCSGETDSYWIFKDKKEAEMQKDCYTWIYYDKQVMKIQLT